MALDKKISESELVALLKANDKAGFEYLYDNYSMPMYNVILRIVNNEETAADVLQDVFVKVWNNIKNYDDKKGRLYTWLINITRNLAIDKTRAKGYKYDFKAEEMKAPHKYDSSMQTPGINPDHIGIMDFVQKLCGKEKELVELAYYKGYSHSEIADEFNIPLGTVKSRLRNAVANLKMLLAENQMPRIAFS